jgi:hypothetical protein
MFENVPRIYAVRKLKITMAMEPNILSSSDLGRMSPKPTVDAVTTVQ